MRQEAAMGVLSLLNVKRRFVPMVGQNALILKNANSVINILFPDLSVFFLQTKVGRKTPRN